MRWAMEAPQSTPRPSPGKIVYRLYNLALTHGSPLVVFDIAGIEEDYSFKSIILTHLIKA